MAHAQKRAERLSDTDCRAFLQWALPQLNLRWCGFRKVHRQVCKRLKRRMNDLGVAGFAAYRTRLEADPAEWRFSTSAATSRFHDFSGRSVYSRFYAPRCCLTSPSALTERGALLGFGPLAAPPARSRTRSRFFGIWRSRALILGVPLSIIATDTDRAMLRRAGKACFAAGSLRELPPPLFNQAFDREDALYCLKCQHREGVAFLHQDLRLDAPSGPFDLILCRYVAFTYFSLPLQEQVLLRLRERLSPEGYLVIGGDERLPRDDPGLAPLAGAPQIFVRGSNLTSQFEDSELKDQGTV